jgi:hypothetical protein
VSDIFAGLGSDDVGPGKPDHAHHDHHMAGRLTVPESIATGFGPDCAGMMGI